MSFKKNVIKELNEHFAEIQTLKIEKESILNQLKKIQDKEKKTELKINNNNKFIIKAINETRAAIKQIAEILAEKGIIKTKEETKNARNKSKPING